MGSRLHGHEGASAVIVAISLLLLFGAGAIAIDLGSAWQTKRGLIVDTDAAALAAARVAADEGCTANAKQAADDFLSRNIGEAVTLVEPDEYRCNTTNDLTTPNTVEIEFTNASQQTLSGALGADEIDVYASSTAEFNGGDFGDLRPIAACASDAAIAAALASPDTPPSTDPYFLSLDRGWKGDSPCIDSANKPSGDWGWVCFDGNCGNSAHDDGIRGMLQQGYQGHIDLGAAPPTAWDDDDSDEDCGSGDDPPWCESANGGKGGATDVINTHMVNRTFSILVHDRVDNLNGGRYHPYAFAYVGLLGWCKDKNNASNVDVYPTDGSGITPAECNANGTGSGDWVFKFRLLGVSQVGTPQSWFNAGPPKVEMCGADNDPGEAANRCDRQFR